MGNKPTIAELKEILDESDLEIEILPNGEIRSKKRRSTIRELDEILTKKKLLGDGY